jgi:hypothetical protein
VGTLVDCLAMPGSEECVIDAALHALEERDVDLIVTNQSHRHWRQALARNGFLPAPTNRFFSPSPEFARLVEPLADKFPLTHLTRGDGAGPIHL